MTLKQFSWMTGLCVALAATSAHSQHREQGDVYVGAGLAYNMAPDFGDELRSSAPPNVSVSVEDKVFGWSAYGGFVVVDSVAVELGYLGNADMEVELSASGVGSSVGADVSTSAIYAAAVAYLPMSADAAVHPFVKAGFARWNVEFSVSEGGATSSVDDDGTDLILGAGIDVPFGESASVRGEYMFLMLEDEDGGSHHRFQVGVAFEF